MAPSFSQHFVHFDLLELLAASSTNQQLISVQAEKVFNQDLYFKKTVKFVGEPMTHLESIASSAVLFNATAFLKMRKERFLEIELGMHLPQ